MANRLAILLCTLLAAVAGLIDQQGGSTECFDEMPAPLEVPVTVDCTTGVARVNLVFDGRSHYELIIGSLADARREDLVHVALAAAVDCQSAGVPLQPRRLIAPVRRSSPRAPGRPVAGARHGAESAVARGSPRSDGFLAMRAALMGENSPIPDAPVPHRAFYLPTSGAPPHDPLGYQAIRARRASLSDRVAVYIDDDVAGQADVLLTAQRACQILEECVIDRIEALFGPRHDCDGDGRLTLLLTPRLADWQQKGGTPLTAFVRPADFRAGLEPPFSNHADLIYMSAFPPAGAALYDVLVHETTHATCFAAREQGATALPPLDDWLAEGLAHAAEILCGGDFSNLDERLAAFLADPSAAALAVANYAQAGLWRDPRCRGAAFLFVWWCIATEGCEVASRVVAQPFADRAALEAATGRTFAELFRSWTLAVASGRIGTLPLAGRVGRHDLAGVAWRELADSVPELSVSVRGTSAAYVRVSSTAERGPRTLTVRAPPGTQLTLVRRPLSDNAAAP